MPRLQQLARSTSVAIAFLLMASVPSLAQTRRTPASQQDYVTTSDIQRLQDEVYDISGDLSRMRGPDADRLQGQLDDLRDEVTYLKVKMRKEGNVSRSEYWDLRDRIESLRSQARGGAGTGGFETPAGREPGAPPPPPDTTPRSEVPPPEQPRASRPNEVPAGSELDVRLQTPLSSATAQPEDRFEATTMVDLSNGNRLLIPAGSLVRGVVTSVNKAGHIDRKGSMTLSFDQVTVHGRSYPIHGTVDQVLQSEGIRGEAGTIGAGAGIGAIIGGILGGVKGALAGILIGGGGTVAATTGKDVELQPGTVLRMRFDSPLIVR